MKISDLRNNIPSDTLKQLKNQNNIVALSGGKDSVATCILLYYLEIPFSTITAEVWWKKDMTGEHPKHYDFTHDVLFPKLQSWGVNSNVIKSNITAYEYITAPIIRSKEHPERIGKYRGFPICGRCGIQRDCKTNVCNRYYKQILEPYNLILGFASNEKDRVLSAGSKNQISLLSLLGIHEFSTFSICNQEKMLSPIYSFSDRNGCWFCPNQKLQELEVLYREHREYWDELMAIQNMPNKVTELFNRTQTLWDIEKIILNGVQIKLFMGDYLGINKN